ncbi:MAG: mechanosensitive ion channel family protein [Kiritimatiellae bacterium]|nr:mechanosensitive ion channel family protein [Kiritimatiellia bacterium]MDD4341285.1 mechanosensitive ion channel family protein [Kiritimatiellia bacterium]
MEQWQAWLTAEVLGNELWRVLVLLGGVLGGLIVGKLVRYYLEKTGSYLAGHGRKVRSALFMALGKAAVPAVFIWGLTLGMSALHFPDRFAGWVASGLDVLGILAIGYVLYALIDVVGTWMMKWAGKTTSKLDDMLVPMVSKSLRVTLIILVVAQIAQSLSDKPVSSILAGLGIGSLAVALAAKDTVSNFFGSLVILSDKPFELGQLIQVGATKGTVESLGFRSTRLRTLDGHLVTIPNGELANQTIENIGQRPSIRRIANLTITYDTPPEKVQEALEIAKDVLKDHEGMHPDFPPRVFFNEFNDVSLNLFMIYWFHPADYWAYMAFTEKVNMDLLRRFNAAGIEFAFPTQTLYLAGDPARPLNIGGLGNGSDLPG